MRGLKHTVLLAAWACCSLLQAQQEWQYSQYMFNLYDANGAFAGAYEQASFAARFRTQWVGVDGAPVSQTLSAHLPAGPVGVGARLQHERLGARSRVLVKATALGTALRKKRAGNGGGVQIRPLLLPAGPRDDHVYNEHSSGLEERNHQPAGELLSESPSGLKNSQGSADE